MKQNNWKNFTRTTGIYKIVCLEENRVYVGQSKDVGSRWKQHLYLLEAGKHHCSALQEAWNLYGFQQFSFQLVLKCKKTELTQKEIEVWDLQESCYNGRPTENSYYPERTAETRAKIAAARKGITYTEETKAKISEAKKGKNNPNYGKARSAETKRKMSRTQSIPILQLDLDGNVIQEWFGIIEAARQLGLDNGNITKCLKGKLKTSGGFRWSYKK
jgi:group I intron endonuclease